jgi:hypothetical protein
MVLYCRVLMYNEIFKLLRTLCAKFNLRFVYLMKCLEEILGKWQLNLIENIGVPQTDLNMYSNPAVQKGLIDTT